MRKTILGLVDEAVHAGSRLKVACEVIGLKVRTLQRWRKNPCDDGRKNNRVNHGNSLTAQERKQVVEVACSPEFRDKSPRQIVPVLAENGRYIASESTFYRILEAEGLKQHRRDSRPPQRKKPAELVATGPNQVWCWDISYLRTLIKGTFFYLYFIMDIWDRCIVGWAIHDHESGALSAELIRKTCLRHEIQPGSLTVHQDNGGPMISSEFLAALAHFEIEPSFSRPGMCDDNPFSESLFRTVKYRPGYPGRFADMDEALEWIARFIEWYNNEHRHSAIGFVTPAQRRAGEDEGILEIRRNTYKEARRIHPERWSRNTRKWEYIAEVKLNPKTRKSGQKSAA